MSEPTAEESIRLQELDALLEDVAAKAQSVRPLSSEGLSDAKELGLALFVSTFEVFLAMRALLRESLAEEARMLSRTLLEDTARLIWLATAGEELDARVLLFHFSSIEHERRLVRAALDNGYEWADIMLAELDEELAAVTEEAARTGVELKKLPNARDTLHAMGYGDLYFWHVKASQVIHSSRIGLSTRFLPRPDTPHRIRIMLASPLDEVARVGAMAVQAFATAIVAANDVLGWDRREELVEYWDRVRRLSGDLFERVKGDLESEGEDAIDPGAPGETDPIGIERRDEWALTDLDAAHRDRRRNGRRRVRADRVDPRIVRGPVREARGRPVHGPSDPRGRRGRP